MLDDVKAVFDAQIERIRALHSGEGDKEREELAQALEGLADEHALIGEMIDEAGEGSLVVQLRVPVKVGDTYCRSVTLSPIRFKHERVADARGGEVWDYCEQLIAPPKALGEIAAIIDRDALMVATRVQLGKYQAAGRGRPRR